MLAAYSIIAETPFAATITTTTFSSGSVAAPSSALLSATERPSPVVFIPHKDLFFVTDNCKGCTMKLEWKSSPGSRCQDQSLSEKKEEEQNLDEKEETQIQHLHLIVSEGITASFEEQSAAALLRVSQVTRYFILTVSANPKQLEEHYVSNLFLDSCVPGFPTRGIQTVLVSFKHSTGKIQKFSMRNLRGVC
ncbi:putative synapsis 1-like protein [Sesbania bispinosa]|nr:putative synapsis 1-like protein [Sesbania bispinosa]